MTCLFFHAGYLAVDSNHVLPGSNNESYIAPTKVVKFEKPQPFHLKKTNGWNAFGNEVSFPIPEDIDDRIHGYTVTGSTTHAEHFMADWQAARRHDAKAFRNRLMEEEKREPTDDELVSMEREALASAFIRTQHAFHTLGLGNDDNGYTLILIGEKTIYRYRPEKEGDKVFDTVDYEMSHAYGSGCEYVHEHWRHYRSHVLAVFATMLSDSGTAGFVEIWKLPAGEKPELYREGLWNPRTKEQIRELLKEGTEPVPDMICPKSARILAQQYFEAGAFLGPIPEALEKHRVMFKQDPSLGEHAVRMFSDTTDPLNAEFRQNFLKEWDAKGWVMRPLTDEEKKVKIREEAKRQRALKRKEARAKTRQSTTCPSRKTK